MRSCWIGVCVVIVGCGSVKGPDDAAVDIAPPTFTIGGTVTGFAGSGLVLRLNGGGDLTISANGAFSFPGSLGNGESYAVTLAAEPTCPQRVCTLASAAGTVTGANVAAVTVTCTVPRFRLASHNWGAPNSVRITDDVLALATNATAMPRIVTGASTGVGSSQVDSVALDRTRNLVYAPAKLTTPDPAILVFTSASTIAGDVAPARQFVVVGGSAFEGIELDDAADRLYVSGATGVLYVFNSASTLTGTVTPTAAITLSAPGTIGLDRKTDRLYVASNAGSLYVFDAARQLTTASTPTRTVTWTTPGDSARGVAIDGCRNRLYLGIRNVAAGVNIYALDNASSLTGALNLQTASQAQLAVPDNQVMSLALDTIGDLYLWKDSATAVHIINAPHSLTGMVTVTPDKTINAVVASGYGLDVIPY